jgi:hypothetical protein
MHKTCTCDEGSWTVKSPICDDFISGLPEYHNGLCIVCWHDESCHRARTLTEAEIRADERRKVIAEIKEGLFK